MPASGKTTNGITFTVNEDTIVANGTATANAYIDVCKVTPKDTGLYMLNGAPNGENKDDFILYIVGTKSYDIGNGVKYSLTAENNYTIRIIVYKGFVANDLTFTPTLIFSDSVNAVINGLKQEVSEPTKNLFDLTRLTGDIKIENNIITGSANSFFSAMGENGKSISFGNIFEEDTQYTISLNARTEQNHGSTGNGLLFRFNYTDDTYSQLNLPNSYTTYTYARKTSDAGKTIKSISILFASYGNNIWHLKDIQLEKGTTASAFVKSGLTAIDTFARNKIDSIFVPSVEMKILGYLSYLGNAIILMFSNGTSMLIDSFTSNAWENVKSDIDACGISRFDYFMLTHWHGDHMGNIDSLIDGGYLDSNTIFFLPQNLDTSASGDLPSDWSSVVEHFNTVYPLIEELGATIIHPTEGQEVEISGCVLKFWNTDHSVFYPNGAYPSQNYNDWSLCAYLFVGNKNICFTGDLGPIGQRKMVDLNTMVKANLYTATHHGWDHGNATNYLGLLPAWINRLNPDVVFSEDYSAHNEYILTNGTPMQSWCEKNCVPNYRTAINGSMDVHLDGYGWKLKGAYSKYIRAYDWGFEYRKKQLRVKIDAIKPSLLKYNHYAKSGANVLRDAIDNMLGSEYRTGYEYTFYIRIIDDGNEDAYLEFVLDGFIYGSTFGQRTILYSETIYIKNTNNVGTFTLNGLVGNPDIVVEIVSYKQTSI